MEVRIELLPGGDVSSAPCGAHLVLEATGGALLHAVRVPEGLFALRAGRARQFQVIRSLPAAAIVHYPPALAPANDAEHAQSVDRARSFIGLDTVQVVSKLVSSGANSTEIAAGGEPLAAECLASLCVTGTARHWHVVDAFRRRQARSRDVLSGVPPQVSSQHGTPGAPSQPTLAFNADLSTRVEKKTPSVSDANPLAAIPQVEVPRTQYCSQTEKKPTSIFDAPLSGMQSAELSRDHCAAEVANNDLSDFPSLDLDSETTSNQQNASGSFASTLQEKALATAVHAGLRGPAAKVAGAAAALGFEGYNLYREIGEHSEQLESKEISSDQYKEKICESAISSSGRAFGGLAGAAAGQVVIPVPFVGAVVGGLVGAACGGLQANSLARGVLRLSGGCAKGGDDLVRCIEHHQDEIQDEARRPQSECISEEPATYVVSQCSEESEELLL